MVSDNLLVDLVVSKSSNTRHILAIRSEDGKHLSIESFNEGIRLRITVDLSQQYFPTCRQLGVDQIYANNANRKFCTLHGIAISFVRKGRKPKQPTTADHMRGILSKARVSLMEGALGNEKLHYDLQKPELAPLLQKRS